MSESAPGSSRDETATQAADGTTLDFSHGTAARLAEQPLQEQPSGAAVARIIIADDITFPSSCRRWGRLGRDDRTPSRSILAS